VVPVPILFGSSTFLDGVDPAARYYEQLQATEEPPTTSTPSPGAFMETYQRLAAEADGIISIHLMATKSGLCNAARLAADALAPGLVHVVDSQSVSLGLGMLVIEAAQMAQRGADAPAILRRLEQLIPHARLHVAVRELTQLRRSGRVSLGQALVANLLAIKPVLCAGNSLVEVADKARGWPQAVEKMVDLAVAAAGQARVRLAVVHTAAEAEARKLLERVRERFDAVEAMVADAGPALASHVGLGALGIVTLAAEPA
jgi:DegV family protein with EDD domain